MTFETTGTNTNIVRWLLKYEYSQLLYMPLNEGKSNININMKELQKLCHL